MGLNGKNGWTEWTLARSAPKMESFLEKLGNTGNVRLACAAAGIPRSTAYMWRKKFATFRDAWEEALEDACDLLEQEAWGRAIKKGSDRLLMFLLQAHRAKVFNPPREIEQKIKHELDVTIRVGGGVVDAL